MFRHLQGELEIRQEAAVIHTVVMANEFALFDYDETLESSPVFRERLVVGVTFEEIEKSIELSNRDVFQFDDHDRSSCHPRALALEPPEYRAAQPPSVVTFYYAIFNGFCQDIL